MFLDIFKRKNKTEQALKEMLMLEDVIYDALTNRGTLNDIQRANVLKRVVERMRESSGLQLTQINKELIQAEKTNDEYKSIMI